MSQYPVQRDATRVETLLHRSVVCDIRKRCDLSQIPVFVNRDVIGVVCSAIFQKMDTSLGLSSIATLSLGLSMSMAGAGRAVMRSLGPGHQQALQQFFPILPSVIQAERVKAKNPASYSSSSTSRGDVGSARRSPRTVIEAKADGASSSTKYKDDNATVAKDGREPAQCSSDDHVTNVADGNAKTKVVDDSRRKVANADGSTKSRK